MTPDVVVAAARDWMGVRWVHQGRSRAGVDCIGLCSMTAQDVGAVVPDVTDYGRYPNADRLREFLQEHCVERFGEPSPGMLALMQFTTEPRHLGFIVPYRHGGLALLHSMPSVGKVAEHRLDTRWRSRIVGLFDLPGVER
jgi:cell wall-associated NlpC family hydrolase